MPPFGTHLRVNPGVRCQFLRITPLPSVVQQPLQIFFSCAFIRASSAPIVSTYFAGSGFAAGAPEVAAVAGFAAADLSADAAGVVALSKQASRAPASGIVLHFDVSAAAEGDSRQIAASMAKSLISTPSVACNQTTNADEPGRLGN